VYESTGRLARQDTSLVHQITAGWCTTLATWVHCIFLFEFEPQLWETSYGEEDALAKSYRCLVDSYWHFLLDLEEQLPVSYWMPKTPCIKTLLCWSCESDVGSCFYPSMV